MAKRPSDGVDEHLTSWEDTFDEPTVKNWNNDLDIPSHYSFSPERLRLFRNGSRQFVQYNSISQFNDSADLWQLQPDAGDTLKLETAESATYVVNYTTSSSVAFSLNQSLADGDRIRVGPFNDSNGWFIEQRGTDHDNTTADFKQRTAGTDETLDSDFSLQSPTTEFNRYEFEYIWYNIAAGAKLTESYTQNDEVKSTVVSETANSGRGPETGNLPVRYEVTADDSTSNLQLNGGSFAVNTRGNVRELTRNKPQRVEVDLASTNDTWLPIYAIRIDSDDQTVNANLTELEILSYGNNTNVELVAAGMDPSKTDASAFSVPDYHHDSNSALESTTNISQVPDDSGTQTSLTSSDKFGGYTLAASQLTANGNDKATSATRTNTTIQKKAILNSDQVVLLARTPNGGATLRFVWDANQRW